MNADDTREALAAALGAHRRWVRLGDTQGCLCGWEDASLDASRHNRHVADALLASGLIPKGATTTQWGVRGGPSGFGSDVATACTDPGGTYRRYDEALARYDTRTRPGDLLRRSRTTYPDRVTEWTEVDA